MRTEKRRGIEYEVGSDNLYADMGLENADELLTRSEIGYQVYRILKSRKLKQREIAALLGIKQPEVSHLMNGHFSLFSTDRLLDFLRRLDHKVVIEIAPRKADEPYQQVRLAA